MNDYEEIKQEVSKKSLSEPIASKPLPHEIIDLEKMIEETPRIAPLFVKIEKYKEILESVQKLKTTLKNIQFLLAFKDQIKKIDAESDGLLVKSMQNISQITNDFSMNFAVPRGINYIPKPPLEEQVDVPVSDIGSKITRLREELDKIRL
jgi:uncharacterized coiled-coil DUF342 family protein